MMTAPKLSRERLAECLQEAMNPRQCPRCGERPPVDKTVQKHRETTRYFYCRCGESWHTEEKISS